MTYDETRRRKQGFKVGLEEAKSFGIEHCKHKFAMRLRCTGCDPCWTVGYGAALEHVVWMELVKESGYTIDNQVDEEDEEWGIKPWEYEIRRN